MSGEFGYTPSGEWPDLDGSGGDGPLELQQAGHVFLFDVLIKSTSPNRGVMAKLIDACDWLKKRLVTALASPVAGWNSGNPVTIATSTNVTSTTFVNLSDPDFVTMDLEEDDQVILFATVMASMDSPGNFGYLRIGDSAASIAVPGAYAVISEDAIAQVVTLVGFYTAPSADTYNFKVMGAVSAGTLTAPQVVSIQAIRIKA